MDFVLGYLMGSGASFVTILGAVALILVIVFIAAVVFDIKIDL